MTETPTKLQARAQRKGEKRDEKKRLIAQSALQALKELGYANTSLRDIAAKSDLSLGMLHYYFEDKTELIIYCVSTYKQDFVRRTQQAIDAAKDRDQVIAGFTDALVQSIIDDEATHRLWYDIQTQAMFDATFRPVVAEIEDMLINVTRLALSKAGVCDGEAEMLYALIDGAFRHLMQAQITRSPRSRADLTAILRRLMEQVL